MAVVNESRSDAKLIGDQLIVHTPVFFKGEIKPSHILAPKSQIERVTDRALKGIDGYIGSDDKKSALESWIGRFATDELYDKTQNIMSWTSNFRMKVEGLDQLEPGRALPFLIKQELGFVVCSAELDPQMFEIESDFTPRATEFLIEKGVIQ